MKPKTLNAYCRYGWEEVYYVEKKTEFIFRWRRKNGNNTQLGHHRDHVYSNRGGRVVAHNITTREAAYCNMRVRACGRGSREVQKRRCCDCTNAKQTNILGSENKRGKEYEKKDKKKLSENAAARGLNFNLS